MYFRFYANECSLPRYRAEITTKGLGALVFNVNSSRDMTSGWHSLPQPVIVVIVKGFAGQTQANPYRFWLKSMVKLRVIDFINVNAQLYRKQVFATIFHFWSSTKPTILHWHCVRGDLKIMFRYPFKHSDLSSEGQVGTYSCNTTISQFKLGTKPESFLRHYKV